MKKSRYWRLGCPLAMMALVLMAWVLPAAAQQKEEELVVYSGRREVFMKPLMEEFQKEARVKLSVKYGKTGELANLIILEKGDPRADVFLAVEPGTMELLRRQGLLDPYTSPNARFIPADYKAKDGSWTGLAGRARVIMYNRNLIKEGEIPKSVFDLADPKWKGKVAMDSSRERSVLLWLASIVAVKGEAFAKEYFEQLARNVKVFPGHTEVRKAVGRGDLPLGIVNHYYYHLQLKEGSPVGVIYPDQGPGEIGTLVFPSTIAILKGAKHPKAARAFVDFMLTRRMQEAIRQEIFEIPLIEGLNPVEGKPLREIKQTRATFEELADLFERTLRMIEPYGF